MFVVSLTFHLISCYFLKTAVGFCMMKALKPKGFWCLWQFNLSNFFWQLNPSLPLSFSFLFLSFSASFILKTLSYIIIILHYVFLLVSYFIFLYYFSLSFLSWNNSYEKILLVVVAVNKIFKRNYFHGWLFVWL